MDFFSIFASLTLISASPIWAGAWLAAGAVFMVQQGSLAQRLPMVLIVTVASLSIYAMVGRPGFEGWAFHSRPDLRGEQSEVPVLVQTTTRLENDPNDWRAYATAGDFLTENLSIAEDVPVAADSSYRQAEQLGGRLTADQYARWAGMLLQTGLDQAPWYEDSVERIIGEALRLDPEHIHAQLLATERLDRAAALPKLQALAQRMSAASPLAEVVDDRILMAVVGDRPAIAPDLRQIDSARVDAVLAQQPSDDDGQPPFMRMVAQLEGKVTASDGGLLAPTGDAEFDQALALDLFRLAQVKATLGQRAAALEALKASLKALDVEANTEANTEVSDTQLGLTFWSATLFWELEARENALAQMQLTRRLMREGSPQWRAVGKTITALVEAM